MQMMRCETGLASGGLDALLDEASVTTNASAPQYLARIGTNVVIAFIIDRTSVLDLCRHLPFVLAY